MRLFAALCLLVTPAFGQVDLELAVFVDSSYQSTFADPYGEAYSQILVASDLLGQAGVSLNVTTFLFEDPNAPAGLDYSSGTQLLNSFRIYMQNNWSAIADYDTAILLHGQAVTDGTGQAYQGFTCSGFRYARARQLPGLSNPDLNAYLIAHEIAHNCNAVHDTTFPPGGGFWLMWPVISGSQTIPEFSPTSIQAIQTFVAAQACLQDFPSLPMWDFIRGDTNLDYSLDITDSTNIFDYAFNGVLPACVDACDVNDDGLVSSADSIMLLNYLFTSGPPPAAPFPVAGYDFSADGLTCGTL